ncbi:MAG: DegT/DnrJ/EryC1/StrS family aminotransferase [Bacteroidota bacterium]
MNIPIAKTFFSEEDKKNILRPLENGWVVQGPFVKEFEEKWSAFTGARHSIAVSNCTTALHLSLAALGIKPGDEVILPAFTWIATANVIEYLGAKPVFCDIDPDTFNIDTTKINDLITPATRAIIPVHLFGYPADVEAIRKIARDHNLFVVEDAACGFASKFQGTHVGNFGNTGCFSFHPRKAITTGEGGMITTNDDKLAALLRAMRDHGATMSDLQRHTGSRPYLLPEFPYLGYNYRMTDLQGSIGSTQMDRAQETFEKRDYWARRYDEALSSVSWIKTPVRYADNQHGHQAYVCMFGQYEPEVRNVGEINRQRNEFMDYLQKLGVSTRPGTHAVHMLKYYADKYCIIPEDFPNAYTADQCSIAFPLFPAMSESEFEYVISSITNYK